MEDKPLEINLEKVGRANLDLGERLFNEGVHLVYDEDGDTLFLTIGEEQPQINVPIMDGVYLCVQPETLKIVGYTVLSFASDLLANNKLFRRLFPNALQAFKDNKGAIDWKGEEAKKIKPAFDLILTR